MQISKFTDYTFRALIYLATHTDKLCTVEELATILDVYEHHMKKVIHQLAKTDYILSITGRGGGLKLNTTPDQINLGEVLKLTEDTSQIVECFNDPRTCIYMQSGCKLKGIIGNSMNKFIEEFSSYTLQDVL